MFLYFLFLTQTIASSECQIKYSLGLELNSECLDLPLIRPASNNVHVWLDSSLLPSTCLVSNHLDSYPVNWSLFPSAPDQKMKWSTDLPLHLILEKINDYQLLNNVNVILYSHSPLLKLQKRSPSSTSSNPYFFDDLQSCISGTNSCSNHGVCSQFSYKSSSTESKTYFKCICNRDNFDDFGIPIPRSSNATWSGYNCQFQDISVQFHLLFWTIVFFIYALASAIALVYGVGEGAGVDGDSTGFVRPKSD